MATPNRGLVTFPFWWFNPLNLARSAVFARASRHASDVRFKNMSSKPDYTEIAAIEVSLADYLDPNLTYLISGTPLQELLRVATGDDSMLGLVSPWFGCLHSEREQAIVDQRLDPRIYGPGRVPVLVCSDDLDFDCTVVIADVFVDDDTIRWKQLGFDRTQSREPTGIGQTVERIDSIGELYFRRRQYEECVDAFKAYQKQLTEQAVDARP